VDLELSDKVVLITGASGGIGQAMAEAFAEEGASLVLHGFRGMEGLGEWLEGQDWASRALTVRADISDPADVREAFRLADERFGRIDIAVANAGVWPAADLPLWKLDEVRVRETLDINLGGVIWTAREFLRSLERHGPRDDGHGSCLLFTGSTAGQFGERGHCDYATSKAALYGLMRSLKNEIVELDPYGRVNMIEPGWTVTEMARESLDEPGSAERIVRTMPLQQIARACEIARAAVMLASPYASRHTSGQVLTIAGGMEGRVRWELEDVDRDALLARLEPAD